MIELKYLHMCITLTIFVPLVGAAFQLDAYLITMQTLAALLIVTWELDRCSF